MKFGDGVNFHIAMRPVPKARPRLSRSGHAFTPKKTADAEKNIAAKAREVIEKPFTCSVCLMVNFVYAVPRSWSKKKREALLNSPRPERPDIDNLYKLVADALNGIAYVDDAQVVQASCDKRYGLMDEIEITILPITEE